MIDRWQWDKEEPTEDLDLPSSNTLTVYSGDSVLWSGDVSPELRAWARWCALQVVHLWDCPEVVRQYLETGDESIREEARSVAIIAAWGSSASDWVFSANAAACAAEECAHAGAVWAARSAVRSGGADRADQLAELERLMVHRMAIEQLRSLPIELRSLYEGAPEDLAVLRDYALQQGFHELAEVLARAVLPVPREDQA